MKAQRRDRFLECVETLEAELGEWLRQPQHLAMFRSAADESYWGMGEQMLAKLFVLTSVQTKIAEKLTNLQHDIIEYQPAQNEPLYCVYDEGHDPLFDEDVPSP